MTHEWNKEQIMQVLQEQGVQYRERDVKHSKALVHCPFHTDRNPSMSIDFNKGLVHAFCGCFSGTFTQFIYKLLGGHEQQAVEYVRRFQNSDDFKFETLPRREIKPRIEIPTWDDLCVTEEELAKYDNTEWLYSRGRGISESVCRKFRVGFDYKRGAVTFPIVIGGETRVICRRDVRSKKFHIPTEFCGRKPLAYAEDALRLAQENKISKVVLVESIYNALTCYTNGIPAVATLGTPTEIQNYLLLKLPIHEVLIACDGDDAGRKFTEKWQKWLKDKKKTTVIVLPEGKDVNDLVMDDPTGQSFNEIIGKVYWGDICRDTM